MVLQKVDEYVLFGKKHRECEEILQSLTKKDINVSRATVYRTLDILVKYELIRKMDIGDGRIRYEGKILSRLTLSEGLDITFK